jgi:hypothetical protein
MIAEWNFSRLVMNVCTTAMPNSPAEIPQHVEQSEAAEPESRQAGCRRWRPW